MTGFEFETSAIINDVVSVAALLVGAWILLFVLRRAIPRHITLRIPRIRKEAPDQLAQRSNTLAGVVMRAVSFGNSLPGRTAGTGNKVR